MHIPKSVRSFVSLQLLFIHIYRARVCSYNSNPQFSMYKIFILVHIKWERASAVRGTKREESPAIEFGIPSPKCTVPFPMRWILQISLWLLRESSNSSNSKNQKKKKMENCTPTSKNIHATNQNRIPRYCSNRDDELCDFYFSTHTIIKIDQRYHYCYIFLSLFLVATSLSFSKEHFFLASFFSLIKRKPKRNEAITTKTTSNKKATVRTEDADGKKKYSGKIIEGGAI